MSSMQPIAIKHIREGPISQLCVKLANLMFWNTGEQTLHDCWACVYTSILSGVARPK